jgi:hypothetical protein
MKTGVFRILPLVTQLLLFQRVSRRCTQHWWGVAAVAEAAPLPPALKGVAAAVVVNYYGDSQ